MSEHRVSGIDWAQRCLDEKQQAIIRIQRERDAAIGILTALACRYGMAEAIAREARITVDRVALLDRWDIVPGVQPCGSVGRCEDLCAHHETCGLVKEEQ
jgi:hypothetical protein